MLVDGRLETALLQLLPLFLLFHLLLFLLLGSLPRLLVALLRLVFGLLLERLPHLRRLVLLLHRMLQLIQLPPPLFGRVLWVQMPHIHRLRHLRLDRRLRLLLLTHDLLHRLIEVGFDGVGLHLCHLLYGADLFFLLVFLLRLFQHPFDPVILVVLVVVYHTLLARFARSALYELGLGVQDVLVYRLRFELLLELLDLFLLGGD